MIRFDHAACAAALTLALMPVVANAEPERVAVTARIAVRDLDLYSRAGKASFDARVRHAASLRCGVAGRDLLARRDMQRCRDEMLDNARVRLAALTTSHPVELAALPR